VPFISKDLLPFNSKFGIILIFKKVGMAFRSKNLFRKCKYCEKEKKINMSSGRNKGYYTTCGNIDCLNAQYKDHHVCALKGKIKTTQNLKCKICENEFKRTSSNHKRYCKECVPDKTWRGRAARYLVGKKQWDILIEKQNNKCALCNKIPEVVDHCHKDGIVRGLLCNSCNVNLKILESTDEYILKVFKYIGKSNVQIQSSTGLFVCKET
jgi:hypothetical protein